MWGFILGNSGDIIFVFSKKVIRGKKGNCGEKIKVETEKSLSGGPLKSIGNIMYENKKISLRYSKNCKKNRKNI